MYIYFSPSDICNNKKKKKERNKIKKNYEKIRKENKKLYMV